MLELLDHKSGGLLRLPRRRHHHHHRCALASLPLRNPFPFTLALGPFLLFPFSSLSLPSFVSRPRPLPRQWLLWVKRFLLLRARIFPLLLPLHSLIRKRSAVPGTPWPPPVAPPTLLTRERETEREREAGVGVGVGVGLAYWLRLFVCCQFMLAP